ncbi:thioredoxin [Stenotrophomonas ginsengisoli]|uniref:Thioredoxin n=1 Tax=Stenotrophomonas ginsengisoli TaxID=336566 RepID=A0A0R0DHD2_9GAMM|nr:tetratricopeptide repeat protein [Stenotrophomonas ginsengisoli]KRG76808.1 thioredoxin [Stenotrophomonas ginsengisoli]
MSPQPYVFDVTAEGFTADVAQQSASVPVLLNFYTPRSSHCMDLLQLLEKLAAEYNGAFVLGRVDVDQQYELRTAFRIDSAPTVFLMANGEIINGFPGLVPEEIVRQMLAQHGIVPAEATTEDLGQIAEEVVLSPAEQVQAARDAVAAEPDKEELKLDLALALLKTGSTAEASALIDALPANLSTDDRAVRAKARLDFAAALADAPAPAELDARIAADGKDLAARHLRGVHHLLGGEDEAALEQFIAMLAADRSFADGLPRKALIDAFRVIEDEELVSRYRRKMSSILF